MTPNPPPLNWPTFTRVYSPFFIAQVFDSPATTLQMLFIAFPSHSDWVPVYSEGFKLADGVEYRAVFPHTTLYGSLPPFASIYTAELFDIYLTLQYIITLLSRSPLS